MNIQKTSIIEKAVEAIILMILFYSFEEFNIKLTNFEFPFLNLLGFIAAFICVKYLGIFLFTRLFNLLQEK